MYFGADTDIMLPEGGENMSGRNICKFVSPGERGQLNAVNFIYENEVPFSGQTQVKDSHVLYLVESGDGYFHCGEQHHRLTAGTVFFSFADVPFMLENMRELVYYYISFTGSRADELFSRFGITPAGSLFRGYEGLLPFWKESLTRADEGNIDLLAESMALYTFSRLTPAARSGNDAVAFVLSYMEDHFTDSALTLRSAAEAAGYNEKYLSHVFRKEYGVSFSEHLRTLRIRHAVMLIENGVTAVRNVAALSGFSDPMYFSKVFRETVGVPPGQYRKKG